MDRYMIVINNALEIRKYQNISGVLFRKKQKTTFLWKLYTVGNSFGAWN